MTSPFLAVLFFAVTVVLVQPASAGDLRVGVAQVDITPDYPVRLSGFGFRRTESEGITQHIWAKAIAFADEQNGPAILITTDNLGVPDAITQEVANRLAPDIGLRRGRLTITASHTHTAPMLRGVVPTLFGVPIPDEHQANIERYTRDFIDKLAAVARAAVKDIQPARVEWGIGNVGFAINRRTPGGPGDHDLTLLAVRAPDGKVRAVWFSYACHCVTLANNLVSGDWAGFAQDAIQREFPGAIALMSAGCGGDANPGARDTPAIADSQGAQIADEVKRLLATPLVALDAAPTTQFTRIELPFDPPRTRAEWEERAKGTDAIGHHARVNLARLDRGETLPTKIDYPVQSWLFGDRLAAVFLSGEVVVDYSLRLKREFDRARLAVVAYANDAPCYIPSERVLKEGGYEGGDAMIYYDRPQKFAPGLEQKIIDAVRAQLPAAFASVPGTEGFHPLAAMDSRHALRTKPGLAVELVASEPLIESPVAIDWDARGRLWVCEMLDYPTGIDGKWKPGGRIKMLTDTDGDGRFDRATVFLDGLPFPTGVMAWHKGVLICSAPDIIYAEDTDGDGVADVVKKIFSGFATDNYQARVNGLSLGLDNWIYGANGLLGGVIHTPGGDVDLRGHDFRMKADTGVFEPVSGLTQHGRVRDDWGRWFGCDNSRPLYHFPLADRYLARNPRVASPPPSVNVPGGADPNRVFPISHGPARYNDPGSEGRFTSACGIGLYRDTLLGPDFDGNAFTCEPVHNLVHREVLATDGITFTGQRAEDERASEFLASTDPWFRPVQARTGPDGALYVVDMYRFLIEHPRWIAPDRLAQIDVRAGASMGRIYRIVKQGAPLRPVRDLTKLSAEDLAAALDTPNGTERDRVHLELLARAEKGAATPLVKLAQSAQLPEVRAQALCALEGLRALTPGLVAAALQDDHARVREQAVRLAEPFVRLNTAEVEPLRRILPSLTGDSDRGVRLQLACTLGEYDDPRAAAALATLAISPDAAQPHFRAALLSSAPRHTPPSPGAPPNALPFLAPLTDAGRQRLDAVPAATAASRAEALRRYQPALTRTGVATRGTEIFARACALCHTLDGLGFDVGPNLAALRDKRADYWLQNILDPSAAIEPRFICSIVTTKDGHAFAGIITSDTATSLTLMQPGGIAATLLRADVQGVRASKMSLMPEGFERSITPEEMADLLAFLHGTPKTLPGNHPEPVTAAAGALVLTAASAEIYGGPITFEREFGNIGFWQGPGDYAAWTARVGRAGRYDIWLDYACQDDNAGNPFVFHAGGAETKGKITGTRAWNHYEQKKIATLALDAGEIRITLQPEVPPKGALLDLRAIHIAPEGSPAPRP